jgi:hypothetical protein
LLVGDSAGRIARELLWTNQEFFLINIIPAWFSMFLYHLGMSNRPVGGRSSETWSHPIDMIEVLATILVHEESASKFNQCILSLMTAVKLKMYFLE